MKTEIVHVETPTQHGEQMPPAEDPSEPKPGRWYWRPVEHEGQTYRYLVCVTRVGSNFVEVQGPLHGTTRIHEDKFHEQCTLEPDPDSVIKHHVSEQQIAVHELMAEVKALTMRLAVTSAPGLPSGEAGALAVYTGKRIDEYKAALVKAEKTTLPDLFKRIQQENALLGKWLSAALIPLEAQTEALTPAISAIKDRIFSVELYAGLVESVVQITDGEPAGQTEKLRLFQRRAYMDEECLAEYETGGMTFENLEGFDAWLAKPKNVARLLPFPRCMLAFQVRRNAKHREASTLADFFRIMHEEMLDKLTFLYIRNGQRLYRLSTSIEFGADLFPDVTKDQLSGKLYAQSDSTGVRSLITEAQWLGKVEEEMEHERKRKECEAAAAKLSKKQAEKLRMDFRVHENFSYFDRSDRYKPFDRTNVYYDDIGKHIADEMKRHNRLVLVLQGLLDRSPVLHPHPPWKLWSNEGFTAALELIYDDDRALTPGEQPDFAAYREKLNAQITVGTVTLGQRRVWSSRKKDNHPYTDKGPDKFARVTAMSKRTRKLTYRWTRERISRRSEWDDDDDKPKGLIACKIIVKDRHVFNIDAYKPGDFRLFFGDPRTRANYLQWAPLLLEAEEYHAGNRPKPAAVTPPPKRARSTGGSYRYQRTKRIKALVGKAVRFTRVVTTKGGTKYEKGSLWRVTRATPTSLAVMGIEEDGTIEPLKPDPKHGGTSRRAMHGLSESDVVVDHAIPADPEYAPKPRRKTRDEDNEDDDD